MATSLSLRSAPASSSDGPALPSGFWQLYKSYKRDTGYVLDWLRINAVENVARNKKNLKSPIEDRLPVRQILRASELISKRRLTAPEYIHGAFKRTLLKRRQLNEWYRQFDLADPVNAAKNESHEHFNDTLAKAYDLIFAHGDKLPSESDKDQAAVKIETLPAKQESSQPLRNFYDILADIEEKAPESPVQELADQDVLPDVPEPKEYVIDDDPLAMLLDLHMYVLEMDAICSAAKQFWKLAADGEMPVPLAAWLTTAGFTSMKRISEVISPAIGGHKGLVSIYCNEKARLGIAGINVAKQEVAKSGENPSYAEFSNGLALITPGSIARSFKDEKQRDSNFMGVIERQPISKYFVPTAEESQQQESFNEAIMATITEPNNPNLPQDQAVEVMRLLSERQSKDRIAMESVLRSITQLIRNEQTKGAFRKDDMNPLLCETRQYLASAGDLPDTSLVFGLQLLLETCKSFVWKENVPNPTNCRMTALRFAQEVKQTIDSVNDHDLVAKNHTVPMAAGLHGVSERLKAFMREKRLDLYSQAPWTGGQQITQILAYTLEAGLSLCNQRGIVGTLLHSYNAVQQLTESPTKNPLLDALSDMFLEPVFLGRLPTSNFDSIWLRFLGGGIDKKSIRGKDGKKFTITLPKQPKDPNNAADFQKRIDAFNLSLFHNLYDSSWMGGPSFWAQVFTNKEKKTASKQEMSRWDAKLHQKPFGHALEMVSRVVASEFTGSFPIARVNFFAVYMICVDILTEVAKRALENPPEEFGWARDAGMDDPNVDAAAGFGFMGVLLVDIDARVDKGPKASLLKHSGLRIVQEAINQVWGEKKLEDFLWRNM